MDASSIRTDPAEHPPHRTLAAFALDCLPADARAALESHVRGCSRCSDFVSGTSKEEFAAHLKGSAGPRCSELTPSEADQDTIRGRSAETPPRPTIDYQPLDSVEQSAAPPVDDLTVAHPPDSDSDADPEEIPEPLRQQTKYRIIRRLGRGGMGSVYLGRHARMDRLVAIKVINANLVGSVRAVERFNAEVQVIAKLDHPNIARAYDAEAFGPLQAIIMEFVPGQTLAEFAKSRQHSGEPVPVDEACRLIYEALLGLQHAHERGIIHRDLKPQNLMLVRDSGTVKILDFGLAKLTLNRTRGLTKSNVTMGTYEYMAPEQAVDAASVDAPADIYSIGCTLYFLLAGKLPFDYDSDAQLLLAHQTEVPRQLVEIRPDVPLAVSELVARMLAKKPADRPRSAAEASEALVPFVGEHQPAKVVRARQFAETADEKSNGKLARNVAPQRSLWIAAALIGVCLLGGALFLRNRSQDPHAADDRISHSVTRPHRSPGSWKLWYNAPEFSEWSDQVAKMPAEQQVAAVTKKLQDLNPGFDGHEIHNIEDSEVTGLALAADHLLDVSPVRALKNLRSFTCRSSTFEKANFSDLTPIEGLPLIIVDVAATSVADLTPIQNMDLETLDVGLTQVSELPPLKNSHLTFFSCWGTQISDISALRGMPLKKFACAFSRVSDISPLAGSAFGRGYVA
jgi:serine/threonine protein kinase